MPSGIGLVSMWAMSTLEDLAILLARRNEVDAQISRIIGRPALQGHIGEFIAAEIFDIQLEQSATRGAFDGRFRSGPLVSRTVNIKWYAKRENLLDVSAAGVPDYFLVLTGPAATPASSRGTTRPLLVENVFLFNGADVVAGMANRGVAIGTASSVPKAQWVAAEVYPSGRNSALILTETQRRLLALFGTAQPVRA